MNRHQTTMSRAVRALGFAGLLPQGAAVLLSMLLRGSPYHGLGATVALGYGAVILSFIGGIWWGMAVKREERQGRLAVAAVVPSLVAAGIMLAVYVLGDAGRGGGLVALGSAVLLTLPVDRHLAGAGDAPIDWMALRVPLSVGLGALTILAGVLAPR